jgi:ribosomal protein S18 acetylase RimI-like enzyme
MPPLIRLATRDDGRAIAALSRTEIEHGLPWRWTPPRVQRAVADPRTNVCVARHGDGSLLGFGIMVYADDTAHLSLLAVNPSARRRGVGSALLLWLEQVAGVAGLERVQLEARRRRAGLLRPPWLPADRHGGRHVSRRRRWCAAGEAVGSSGFGRFAALRRHA